MAFTTKALANGQLANTKGTLYTTPGATQTIVKTITLVNTGASTRTINIYLNTSGTSRRIIPKDTSLLTGEAFYIDLNLTLEAADLIEGDASAATEIDYTISGIEEA